MIFILLDLEFEFILLAMHRCLDSGRDGPFDGLKGTVGPLLNRFALLNFISVFINLL